jgi:hypothetical protein
LRWQRLSSIRHRDRAFGAGLDAGLDGLLEFGRYEFVVDVGEPSSSSW